jgi:uracil-DNA glycosylase family 4
MDKQQEKIIKEMGIGPLWKLRQETCAAELPGHDQIPLQPMHQSGLHSSESAEIPFGSDATESTCCAVCGMTDASSKALSSLGNLRPHYLIVAGASGHAGITENDHESGWTGVTSALLNNMLLALDAQKNEKILIAHIVTRLPGATITMNIPACAQEFSACFSCVTKQIDLMRPLMIIALGDAAARCLLDMDSSDSPGPMRGQMYQLQGSPLVVTTHPVDLVRKPKEKANVWSDLCLAMASLTAT